MTLARDPSFERLIMLSDGVFAIAMTLMALDVHAPDHADRSVAGVLLALAPTLQSFFWSFFSTAMFWVTSRRLLGYYSHAGFWLTTLNLIFLGGITLVPVATRLLGELNLAKGMIEIYVGLFMLLGLTSAAIWLHAALVDRVVQPPPGPFRVAAVTLMRFTPAVMAGLGIYAALPGRHWLGMLIPPAIFAMFGLRRGADWADRRLAGAVQASAGAG